MGEVMKHKKPTLDDPDMQAVPAALMRAAERSRLLALQTGTPWVVLPTNGEGSTANHPFATTIVVAKNELPATSTQ
jgi:hypothetical protein